MEGGERVWVPWHASDVFEGSGTSDDGEEGPEVEQGSSRGLDEEHTTDGKLVLAYLPALVHLIKHHLLWELLIGEGPR